MTIAKQYLHVTSKRIIYIYRININMLQYDSFVSDGHMVLFTPEWRMDMLLYMLKPQHVFFFHN